MGSDTGEVCDLGAATYGEHGLDTPLRMVSGRIGHERGKIVPGRGHGPLNSAASHAFSMANARRRVREDGSFYVPDVLSDKRIDFHPGAYTAAADHARHLGKAERLLDEAQNLVKLMLASIGDLGDGRAMQSQIGLKVIEKKLSKVHAQIDKHDTRHTNLFFAYLDLKGKADFGERE